MSVAPLQLLKSEFNPLVYVALDNATDKYVSLAYFYGTTGTTPSDAYFTKGALLVHAIDATLYQNTAEDGDTPTWSALGGGGGGGMVIGDAVVDADASSILYVDGSGNLTQDVGFTRTSTGVTKVLSTFGPATTEFQVSDNLFGLGFSGIGNKLSVGADSVADLLVTAGGNLFKAITMQFADGSSSQSNLTSDNYGITVSNAGGTNRGILTLKNSKSRLFSNIGSGEFGVEYDNNKVKLGHINGFNYIEYDTVTGLYKITNVPTYADDAAAITGGLVTGNLYKTTTGGITALNIVP